jgi:protein phosphatase 2C family protein 2/3
MEDAHAAILDLHAKYTGPTDEKPTDPEQRLAFFGVYDGHGGDKVALFTGENLHKIVSKQESFAKGDIEQALKDGFLATDRAILEGSCPPGLARERRTSFPSPLEEDAKKKDLRIVGITPY